MTRKFRGTIIAIILISPGLLCACNRHAPEDAYRDAPALNETAAFLAGLEISPVSALHSAAVDPGYIRYKNQMNRAWKKYDDHELGKIKAWSAEKLRGKYTRTVFYPFSGPDILNAAAFFPDAEEFIMMGLEPPGDVPEPGALPRWKIISELRGINTTLRTLMMLNFFRTAEMQADIKGDTFTSVTGIMMFFLARSGYEILEVRRVTIGPDGTLNRQKSSLPADAISGVGIYFRKDHTAPVQRAYYFKVDLSDDSLKKLPHFVAYINKHERISTFLKSGSYLLGYDYFSTLRKYILSRTSFMVQDDAGIPLKHLLPVEWNTQFFGKYRALEMFRSKFQPDLAKSIRERNSGLLPFSYGYGFVPERSHLMIVERKKDRITGLRQRQD